MTDKLNIILNGKNVTGIKGETILELAKRYSIEIPTLCNDERLEPYTSCYICVVEVDGMKGLQPACSTKINEGMKIETYNSRIYKARKTALDLLLSNHYADCLGPCKQTCPAGVDVQGYISLIEKKMYNEAVALIKETNPLPAICGRVCVRPCEVACRRNLLQENAAVGIDYLKRFASDFDLASENKYKPILKPDTGKKVAIIGAGPAGLSAAFFLRKEGHSIDIYEAAPAAGGWLRYGIPEYRLPNDLLQKEVDNITEMGVRIFYNQKLGDNLSFKSLKFRYDSIILAIGSQKGVKIGCEGDDAENVLSGIDFLKTMELTKKLYDFKGKTVAVIGGGNTAMDCCRTSKRCGAEKVYVVYRRTEKEMPANPIEIHESKLEGVEYMFLTAPVKVNKDEKGVLKSITCIKMTLGEPDASGRRRPVAVEGSESEIKVDYILAAIGQKTYINFIDEINKNTDDGELKMNKWGDIDANPDTLQTGIKSMFAAGDGVSGPATLIQAIAQARIAARSCTQFLNGLHIEPEKKEFISKRENFKVQKAEDYADKYKKSNRNEMPTMPVDNRNNFKEVELGYENEDIAFNETQRCLECGCSAYFICDLKRYATEYDVDQNKYSGDFKEYNVDFRHPFIEIDNNKCILCSRCIRICKEVVGANALGLVNRGFKTFVAPSMGDSLPETNCESCGLCISTCPTGAISENFSVKPGPVKLQDIETICNYCSVGCKIKLQHKNGYVFRVEGAEGKINKDGNICRFAKFGYKFYNEKRLTKPLIKRGDKFEEASFEEAYNIIKNKIDKVNPDENAFFAGARLSNEELYLIQKLARLAVKTNNISSFHYTGRGQAYFTNACKNTNFVELDKANKIYLIGSEIDRDNPVVGYMINNARFKNNSEQIYVTTTPGNLQHKSEKIVQIKNYYFFLKAVNHYLLSKGLQNDLYIRDNCDAFDTYKTKLLAEDYNSLLNKTGLNADFIAEFAETYNKETNAIIVFSEKELSSNCCFEIFNLAMLTGKLGKTGSGLISLKEKNNSQGLIDMGISPEIGIGGVPVTDTKLIDKLKKVWIADSLPENVFIMQTDLLKKGKIKNVFIFGEDPIGTAIYRTYAESLLAKNDFLVVSDYFITETAAKADIILPASLPYESGGTFTNTQKIIQNFDKLAEPLAERTLYRQLSDLINQFVKVNYTDIDDIMMEVFSLLPDTNDKKITFKYTPEDDDNLKFQYGCDYIVKYFSDEFSNKLNK